MREVGDRVVKLPFSCSSSAWLIDASICCFRSQLVICNTSFFPVTTYPTTDGDRRGARPPPCQKLKRDRRLSSVSVIVYSIAPRPVTRHTAKTKPWRRAQQRRKAAARRADAAQRIERQPRHQVRERCLLSYAAHSNWCQPGADKGNTRNRRRRSKTTAPDPSLHRPPLISLPASTAPATNQRTTSLCHAATQGAGQGSAARATAEGDGGSVPGRAGQPRPAGLGGGAHVSGRAAHHPAPPQQGLVGSSKSGACAVAAEADYS
jgi:hypothetical protein